MSILYPEELYKSMTMYSRFLFTSLSIISLLFLFLNPVVSDAQCTVTAQCMSADIILDGTCMAVVTPNDIDNGSTATGAGCAIASRTVSPNTFTSADAGEQTVTLTITDNNGATSTCQTQIMIQEPCPNASQFNITIAGSSSPSSSPIVYCTNAGVQPLAISAMNNAGVALCIDDDAGVFNSVNSMGITDGPNNTGSFDPAVAGPGMHIISFVYTCPISEEEIGASLYVDVVANPVVDLVDDFVLECGEPSGTLYLSNLFEMTSTQTGSWTYISGPAGAPSAIANNNYSYTMDGCYSFNFVADDPNNCIDPDPSQTVEVQIQTKPDFTFSLSNQGGCLGSGTLDVSGNIEPALPAGESMTGTVQVGSGAPTAWDPTSAYTVNAPSSGGTADYTLCVTREKTGMSACGMNGPCPRTICRSFSVYNDGLNCQSNCEMNEVDVCNIEVDPQLTLACSFFQISVPFDLVGANISPNSQLISCDDEEVLIDYNFEIGGFNPEAGGGGATIGSLPGIGIICDVFNFCICIDVGFTSIEIRPFSALYDALGCDKTIAQLILELLGKALGGDGGGALVVADTDGDGAFDYEVEDGSNLSGSGVAVPVNIEGQGELTIRMVSGWPNKPEGVCGSATVPGQDLLTLLPIGAIPIVGPTIVAILGAADCNVDLSWSNEETVVYPVINGNAPEFKNCPTDGYTFSQDFSCDTEANWSIPVATDGCTGEILEFTTDTGTTEGVRKVSGPDPGDDLAVGIYSVVYEATACNGMTTQCIIPITIDAGDPQLVAPENFVVCADIDKCEANVLGLAPLRGIGCNTTISYYTTGVTTIGTMAAPIIGEASGVDFELGLTTVNYIMTWTDAQGTVQTLTDNFTVTIEDCQKPVAECQSFTTQLDNEGNVTVTALQVDGQSSDNCTAFADLDIDISKTGGVFTPDITFNCDELGVNVVTIRVIDEAGNENYCLAQVTIVDFFEDFTLTLDAPEICLEANNPEQFDFTNYLNITQPNGTIIGAADVMGVLGGDVVGLFGITSFIPSSSSSGVSIGTSPTDPQDIGYIDPFSGVYTPGVGSGYVTISYVLTQTGTASQNNNALDGCFKIVHETFELKQPLVMGSPMCECLGVNSRQVDLGVVTGGLEPYRIEYVGGTLDHNEDGTEDDIDGIYTYDVENGFDISDGMEDLGLMWLNYTSPVWSITVVDARGCEIARSGSCDIIDETVGPEIDCRGTNDFDTEVFICERQYSWLHAIPTDNCAVTQYSYTITNPDGTIEGPFTLNALIDDANNGIPLEELLNAEYEFESGASTVSYYAEDAVGNLATCSFVVVVEDNDPPYFINCPYPDVVIATETDQCDVFVNFALPLAEDNCVMPEVTQIDDTGLVVGDRFPVGTTILTYQAVDGVGNKTICNVKVIVNHFEHVPTITCPGDVEQLNDDWLCGATVNNINALADELCDDELVKTYQVIQDGQVITTGLDDASGNYFEVGESQVTYRVQNQPLLLITEITQDADALIGGMNPPPIVNEFQCFSDTLFNIGNGDVGNGLVYYAEDDLIYHFSGATTGNQYFEEIYFPGECVQPNHVIANTYGPDAAGEVTGMVWDDVIEKFIAMDENGNIFTVSTTGDYLQISTYDQAFPLAGFATDGTSRFGVNGTNLYQFNAGTGVTLSTTTLTSDSDAIVSAIDITTDNVTGTTYIIYTTAASATTYIGTVDLATGAITESGDTFIDFSGITVDAESQVYGVSSKAAGSDLYTIKCAVPGDDYIEITNFGPSVYDVSCLSIDRTLPSGAVESYIVPAGTVLAPGDVIVLHYGPGVDNHNAPSYFLNYCEGTDQPANAAVSYSISYGNNMIDAMTMFDNAQGGIIRQHIFDTNTPADFRLAEDCLPIALGNYNTIYPDPINNSTTASLQSEPMSIAECDFTVTVSDAEAPKCMEIDDIGTYTGPAIVAEEGECNQSIISIPEGDECILTEINVSITGNIIGAENIEISLISPQNDTLSLYDRLCDGDAAVDLTFDDESENGAATICGSWTGDVRPQAEMLMKFYTSKLAGDWIIFVEVDEDTGASFDLTSWTLESTCMMDWEMEDVVLENDPTVCNAEYSWIHPYYVDNCTFGSIRVDYLSDEDIDLPTSGLLLDNFRKGGYDVTETFSVGVTTVQYTLVDDAGNQSQCSFTVTVNDTELPVITECPNDILVGLEGGECEEIVIYNVEAMDNCGIESIIGVPASGTYFSIGTTPVVVTVTDVNGNTSLCEFDVIVLEYEPESNQVNCNNAINLSLDENCEAIILADQILEGNEYGCYDDYCIEITSTTGIPHDNLFGVNDINETFIVSVIDCNTDSLNSCWGTVTIEEKFTPEIQCPNDVTIACNQNPDALDAFGELVTGEAFLLNCEPGAEIIYEDQTTDFGQCSSPRMEVSRTWIVTDADGNQSSCNQIITIDAIDLDNIVFPEDVDLDKSLECFDVNLDASLTSPDSTGYPTINGHLVSASGSLCMISMNTSDEIYDICPGSYEILRTWKIRNMCLPVSPTNPITHTQVIKVLDTTAPKMVDCPEDMLLSVDPWGCQGSSFLPIPQNIYDQCSDVVFSAAIYGGGNLEISGTPQGGDLQVFASDLRKGLHTVAYRTKDECGNINECEFDIVVEDKTPPTAIALQDIVVSISSGNTSGEGTAKLYVEALDNGSHDGCTDIKLEIRRDNDPCGIVGNTTYNNDGHANDNSLDTDGGAFVKFCCEDITSAIIDVDGDGVNDVGYVKVWLRVWDDGDLDGTFGTENDNFNEAWAYVKVEDKLAPHIVCPADVELACDMDYTDLDVTGVATAFASCGQVDVEYNDIFTNLDACGVGFVRREWYVVGNPQVSCQQTILMTDVDSPPVTLNFASVSDIDASECPDMVDFGEPTWMGGPCDLIGYTLETDTFLFEDGACFKLINHWTVINWCSYKPNDPNWVDLPLNQFDVDGYEEYSQVVKFYDDSKPEIASCDDQMYAINDHSDEDDDGDVCEAKLVLTNSAIDEGSENCPTSWLKWQVTIDLWGDGTIDLEYSSFLPVFDTQFNDSNGNGIPDRYIAPTANGENVNISLPDIGGSMSNHKVNWSVTDGCNNTTTCSNDFMVVDKKAPTPYCIDVSSSVMENTGTVELWAIDFNLGSFDNCTDQEALRFTFTDVAPENDPNYDADSHSSSRVFDCTDAENSPVEVKMYVWDEKGNVDFCIVNLSLIDSNGACGDGSRVSGLVATEYGDKVEEVEIRLDSGLPEFPRQQMTNSDGLYAFLNVPTNESYVISGDRDTDYLNGVSTLDLVKIQRHILGLESFDSPYKTIAADINNDESVKSNDLLQLRKLILGIDIELANNTSWRFIDTEQEFDDIFSPWPLTEELLTGVMSEESSLDNNFVAVKIGDISGDATANVLQPNSVVRSGKTLELKIDDRLVKEGELIEVEFTSEEFKEVFGYQFTIELNGLEFRNVVEGKLEMGETNLGLFGDKMTVSYHNSIATSAGKDENLFTLNFVAKQSGVLSNMIDITNRLTRSEAYVDSDLEIREVVIGTRGDLETESINALFQNEPNPFRVKTMIGFELVENGQVTLTITDVTGRIVKSMNIDGVQGYNAVSLNAKDFAGLSGILYYTIESGDFTDTKKMMLVK